MKLTPIDELPEGAVRVHMYNHKDVLRPRGHMQKESIAEYLLDRLLSSYESWTDGEFGDNPEVTELIATLQKNMKEEVYGAWREFIKRVNIKK